MKWDLHLTYLTNTLDTNLYLVSGRTRCLHPLSRPEFARDTHHHQCTTQWPSGRAGIVIMPPPRRLEDVGEPCAGLEGLADLITRALIEAPNRIPEDKIQKTVETAGGDSTQRHWQEQVWFS